MNTIEERNDKHRDFTKRLDGCGLWQVESRMAKVCASFFYLSCADVKPKTEAIRHVKKHIFSTSAAFWQNRSIFLQNNIELGAAENHRE